MSEYNLIFYVRFFNVSSLNVLIINYIDKAFLVFQIFNGNAIIVWKKKNQILKQSSNIWIYGIRTQASNVRRKELIIS